MGAVVVTRIYGDPGRGAGDVRVLVDRLWPRGITRAAADLDEWARDAAPSPELRRWYAHDEARFDEFRQRYELELREAPAVLAVTHLADLAVSSRLVLITATRDLARSSARVLADELARVAAAR
ncbi:MAG: DUF488 domain-containing protein [Acidimicrobiales bacterium]